MTGLGTLAADVESLARALGSEKVIAQCEDATDAHRTELDTLEAMLHHVATRIAAVDHEIWYPRATTPGSGR